MPSATWPGPVRSWPRSGEPILLRWDGGSSYPPTARQERVDPYPPPCRARPEPVGENMADDPIAFDWEASRDECLERCKSAPQVVATELRKLVLLVERCVEAKDGTGAVPGGLADETRKAAEEIRLKLSTLSLDCHHFSLAFPGE